MARLSLPPAVGAEVVYQGVPGCCVVCLRAVFEGLHALKDVVCVWVKLCIACGVSGCCLYSYTGLRVVMSLFLNLVYVGI